MATAKQRTVELDSKPDASSWFAAGCAVLLLLGIYLMYAVPYANETVMRITNLVAIASVFMWARATWVSGFTVRTRTVILTLLAAACVVLALTTP